MQAASTPAEETPTFAPVDQDPIGAEGFDPVALAGQIWDYRLFRVGDTEVAVSQIVIAVLVLVAGVLAARLIATRVGQRVLPRMRVNKGAASALQAILYYTLLAVAVMIALQVAGVPLTVFTLFGGIVALGVGFGSQNIVSNFISGLIILIERPISVGDLVVIDDKMGTVKRIGARATHIEDYLGTTVIIPNSYILENRISNLWLPTSRVRSSVTVGVAYGSDTALVTRLLEQAVHENDRVLNDRESAVLFTDFADSALVFETHFWIQPKNTLDKLTIESKIRYRIDELFREHKVQIPFPQRDTNLKTDQPIEVRLAGNKG
ncbi:MAG: mechanosensitive ion channel protein [Planctomycetota bacterium]|nr:MAG: mechanosensitive ion channel protein [Planctomycetota bacterium]